MSYEALNGDIPGNGNDNGNGYQIEFDFKTSDSYTRGGLFQIDPDPNPNNRAEGGILLKDGKVVITFPYATSDRQEFGETG